MHGHATRAGFYTLDGVLPTEMLRQRKGIPMVLCAMLAAVGHKVGLKLQPISFPYTAHVRMEAEPEADMPEAVFIDVFECELRLATV